MGIEQIGERSRKPDCELQRPARTIRVLCSSPLSVTRGMNRKMIITQEWTRQRTLAACKDSIEGTINKAREDAEELHRQLRELLELAAQDMETKDIEAGEGKAGGVESALADLGSTALATQPHELKLRFA